MSLRNLLLTSVCISSTGFALPQLTPAEEVSRLLTGEFSSAAQAERDSDYFHIEMKSCLLVADWIPTGERWIYVEQGQAAEVFRPYRQRFYAIKTQNSVTVASNIHEVNTPADLVGWCEKKTPIAEDQVLDSTCQVELEKQKDGTWTGSNPLPCPTDFNGATTVRTQVELTPTQVISWDLGYDATGQVVWGPESGGYIFDRKVPAKK